MLWPIAQSHCAKRGSARTSWSPAAFFLAAEMEGRKPGGGAAPSRPMPDQTMRGMRIGVSPRTPRLPSAGALKTRADRRRPAPTLRRVARISPRPQYPTASWMSAASGLACRHQVQAIFPRPATPRPTKAEPRLARNGIRTRSGGRKNARRRSWGLTHRRHSQRQSPHHLETRCRLLGLHQSGTRSHLWLRHRARWKPWTTI